MRARLTSILLTLAVSAVGLSCKHDNNAAAIAAASAPTIAGNAGTSVGQTVTIWWAQWAPADGLQQLAQEYEKQTNIAVRVHQIPWSSYQDQVFLNFGNKATSFDIVVGDSQWLGRGATGKLYLDLTDWLPTVVDVKTIHPQALRYLCEYPAGTAHYFAAPGETDAVGFAYRKDWFDDPAEQAAFKAKYKRDLAVPGTWEEFKDIAEYFTQPQNQRYGTALLTGRGYDALVMGFQPFLWEFGGSWGDPESFKTKGLLDTPGAVEGLTLMKSLLKFAPNDGPNMDYGKTLEAFTSGSTAMAMNYFAFYPTIVKAMGDKAGFFVMPAHNGKRFSSLGGQGMSISAKVSPEQQKLAKDFIAWFLKRDTQEKWTQKEAGFTANAEILNSAGFKQATPYNAPFSQSMDYLQDFWNVPAYNELLAVAEQRLGEALDGVKTPKEALEAISTEHDRIFKEAGLSK
jgi:multiple sugar transport system substrate-binding protein